MTWMTYVLNADDVDANGGTWKPEYDQGLHGRLLVEKGVRKVLKALNRWIPPEQEETC